VPGATGARSDWHCAPVLPFFAAATQSAVDEGQLESGEWGWCLGDKEFKEELLLLHEQRGRDWCWRNCVGELGPIAGKF